MSLIQHFLSRLSFSWKTQLKKTTSHETGVQESSCTSVGFSVQLFCVLLPGTVKAAAEPGGWSGGAPGSLKSPVENSHGYSMGMLTPLLVVQELGLKFKIVVPNDVVPAIVIAAFGLAAAAQEAEKPLLFREKSWPAAFLVCNHC